MMKYFFKPLLKGKSDNIKFRFFGIGCFVVYSIAISVALSTLSCNNNNTGKSMLPDPAKVTAHSNGFISRSSNISVVLNKGRDTTKLAGINPFSINPSINGTVVWNSEGDRVDFVPATPLKAGQTYKIVFDFKKLDASDNSWFNFSVKVAQAQVTVKPGNLYITKNGSLALDGTVFSGDIASTAELENIIRANVGATKLKIKWMHDSSISDSSISDSSIKSRATIHKFTIDNIPRNKTEGSLVLAWNAKSAGSGERGKEKYRIPVEGSFEVLSINAPEDSNSSCITIAFSDVLDKSQDLRGLVHSNAQGDLRFEPEGSVLKVYSSLRWPEKTEVKVEPGVRGLTGALAQPVQAIVRINWEIPEVRFQSGGVIVPTTQGTKIVLETKNLSKVYVEALHIYQNNILQFLQTNDLEDSNELKRVGDVVWNAVIDLGPWKEENQNRWISHTLDLTPLTENFKGGMFQLRVTFSREHIHYVSPNTHANLGNWVFPPLGINDGDENFSYWNYYDKGFDWDEYYRYRNDPTHPAFYIQLYGNDKSARRNILVSDIALTAKLDSTAFWHITVNDIKSARPLSGAKVTLYSYSKKELASGSTDKNGFVLFKPSDLSGKQEPYILVAETSGRNPDIAYMKIGPAYALSVSHFDIAGEKADSGLKGFIYGERGVWRPGDDIHLGFILYDKLKTLPIDHPVQFELANPLGQIVQQASYTSNTNGVYYIKTFTDQSAPTGNWMARVKVGGKSFEKRLKIESIMPNRLKLKLDYGKDNYISTDTNSLGLNVSWLHGAIAPGLKADVSMYLMPSGKVPGNFSGYSFADPLTEASEGKSLLFDGTLDSKGQAVFKVNFNKGEVAPGPMTAVFISRAFERSGLFSSEQFSVDYHPFKRYIGVKLPGGDSARNMLLTDKDHEVELILVDRDGKIGGKANVEISLYKLNWRWWWEKGEENLAAVASDVFNHLVTKDTVNISSGRASWKFKIKYPEWGRYLIRVYDKESGHSSGQIFYIDWPGWAGAGKGEGSGSAAMLELATDKEKYSPGETAKLSFPSNKEAMALISLEKSGQIISEEWIQAKEGQTEYKFKISSDMAPNIYAHVTFIQPHLQTQNDLPIRLYGIVPIMVEDPGTRLYPIIASPAQLEPNKKTVLSVSEKNGKSMTYTLAVVEEGLLGITRYSTPNPWNEFYKKEASTISSWDIYKDVAGAYSGILQTLISIGGSEFEDLSGTRQPGRFPPVVQFFGPFILEKDKSAKHEIELGPYNGAVRFMLVASDPKGAYGCTEKEVPVRSDLMTFMTLPRVLGPGEDLTIPVSVFGYMGKNAKVDLSLKSSGQLNIIGDTKKTISFKEEGEEFTSFTIKTDQICGDANLTLTASGINGKTSTETINIAVRSSAIPVTQVSSILLNKTSKANLQLALPGTSGTNESWLELSLLPPVDLSGRLAYLLDYPHGCCEQTVSKAFPQMFLEEVLQLSPEQRQIARANVAEAINKMVNFQLSGGGFSFWPNSYNEDDWLSAYVCHFLVSAKSRAYSLPEGMLEKALSQLKTRAATWNAHEDYNKAEQAYRLYVLSLAGEADIASLNRFMDYAPFPPFVVHQYAAAYALAGFKDKARTLLYQSEPVTKKYNGMEKIYASELRDKAVMLDVYNALGDNTGGLGLYNQIASVLSSTKSLSTQDLSYSLIAVLPYIKESRSAEAKISYEYNKGSGTVVISKGLNRLPVYGQDGLLSVNLQNYSANTVYARLISTGTPAPGSEAIISNGLRLSVRYLDSTMSIVDPSRLALGSDMIAELSIANTSAEELKNVALTYRIASGWELGNLRLGMDAGSYSSANYDYQDFRDDRVMTYFGLKRGELKTFQFFVNKTYEGNFFLPAINAEVMYMPEYYAVLPGKSLVTPTNKKTGIPQF